MTSMRFAKILVLFICLFLLVGCAKHAIVVSPSPFVQEEIKKMPLSVVLCIPHEHIVYNQTFKRDLEDYFYDHLGRASRDHFVSIYGQYFESVEYIPGYLPDDYDVGKRFDLVVTPNLVNYECKLPLVVLTSTVLKARATYTFKVQNSKLETIYNGTFEGVGDKNAIHSTPENNLSLTANKAIQDGVMKSLNIIRELMGM